MGSSLAGSSGCSGRFALASSGLGVVPSGADSGAGVDDTYTESTGCYTLGAELRMPYLTLLLLLARTTLLILCWLARLVIGDYARHGASPIFPAVFEALFKCTDRRLRYTQQGSSGG